MREFNKTIVQRKDFTAEQEAEWLRLFDSIDWGYANVQGSSYSNVAEFFDFYNHEDERLEFLKAIKDYSNGFDGKSFMRNNEMDYASAVSQYLRNKFDIPPRYRDGDVVRYDDETYNSFKQAAERINLIAYNIASTSPLRKEFFEAHGIKTMYDIGQYLADVLPQHESERIVDEGIEQTQVNGGMSEAAMVAEISAEENHRPDYIDEQGNPHWFDEEEEYDDGQIPLEVLSKSEMTYFNSDEVSVREYKIRIDEGLFRQLAPEQYSETKFAEDEIPCITYRQSANPENPAQFLISKFREGNYDAPLIQASVDISDEELLSQIKNVTKNYETEYQEDLSQYYERFKKETEGRSEEVQLQKAIALSLDKNVSPLVEVKLNRENWNKLFPDGMIETPTGVVKLGENQFEKLQKSDRNNLLGAMYETLSNPSIVLEKETLDEKTGEFKPVNVYGKSFVHEDTNHKRAVESVIIFKDGENISIGTHNKNIKDFVKQIKTADQVIFADSEISRVASLILQNGGSHVRLQDALATEPFNPNYNKNNLLSIKDLEFSDAEESPKNEQNSSLEKSALEKAADLLKGMNFNSENYKDLLSVINKISEMNGVSPAPEVKAEELSKPEPVVLGKSEEQQPDVQKTSTETTVETTKAPKPEQTDLKTIVYGKTVLPGFIVFVDGKLQPIDNAVITGYDKDTHKYLIESNGERFAFPGETLQTMLSPESNKREEAPVKNIKSKGIVFADPAKGIKGTVIPEFGMKVQGQFKVYKDCVVTGYNPKDGSYTLSNGNATVSVTGERFKEITAPEKFEQKFEKNTPAYKKILQSQYDDFFKLRANTAYNFRHNLSVYCRKEANSPMEALTIAKVIVSRMSPEEKAKTKELLKKLTHENETRNELLVRMYNEAVKDLPLNEKYLKTHNPAGVIARKSFDNISDDGRYIESDPALIRGGSDRNLKVGDTLHNIDFKSGKVLGMGKDKIHFDSLKVVCASKNDNSITLVDGNKSFVKLPRDTFLEFYKKQQLKEMKQERHFNKHNKVDASFSY